MSEKHIYNYSLVNTWAHMIARCTIPDNPAYPYYGGRGIKVCERWTSNEGLLNFLDDVGAKPTGRHTLDRIDTDGDYSPENTRWATWEQQAHNRRKRFDNKSGYNGIFVVHNKKSITYRVTLGMNGKCFKSKKYKTLEAAIEARKNLDEQYVKPLYLTT